MSGTTTLPPVYEATQSLFSEAAEVALLRSDRLMRVAARYFPGQPPSQAYIWSKLRAAEADLQRQLRVFLQPTFVVPDTWTPAMVAAANTGKLPLATEPGYDYDPQFFMGESFGLITLRHRPVIKVLSITLDYPSPTDLLWTIPVDWIRVDPKIGHISLVPVSSPASLPLNAYLLSALGGGRTIPLMLQVAYVAGLRDAANAYPDLLDVIRKAAILSMIDDLFLPSSGSLSIDGMSQSSSWDGEKHALDKRVDRLRDAIHGIRVMVF